MLLGQHSKEYQGISADHHHVGEAGFINNNCYGYALGRAEGKTAGDYYCDPTEIHASGIFDYTYHSFNDDYN